MPAVDLKPTIQVNPWEVYQNALSRYSTTPQPVEFSPTISGPPGGPGGAAPGGTASPALGAIIGYQVAKQSGLLGGGAAAAAPATPSLLGASAVPSAPSWLTVGGTTPTAPLASSAPAAGGLSMASVALPLAAIAAGPMWAPSVSKLGKKIFGHQSNRINRPEEVIKSPYIARQFGGNAPSPEMVDALIKARVIASPGNEGSYKESLPYQPFVKIRTLGISEGMNEAIEKKYGRDWTRNAPVEVLARFDDRLKTVLNTPGLKTPPVQSIQHLLSAPAAPVVPALPARSSTLSPGIGKDGKRISYSKK